MRMSIWSDHRSDLCSKKSLFNCDRFRERGVKVILGGVHPSLLPEEAKEHADSVFIGEAEGMLDKVIADFESGISSHFIRIESG